ncbi:MAG: hypothetical protein ACI4XL_05675 [Bacillus sp. (in: firmicutes)]
MKGIILLNKQAYGSGEKGEVRLLHEAGKLLLFAQQHQIELVRLNPDQLNIYYTIPFALHYDLEELDVNLDCLLIHSASDFEDFQIDYGEYWEAIRSRFTSVLEAEHHVEPESYKRSSIIDQDLPPISNL